MKYDVFISYSRKDSTVVNSLIDRLRREIPSIKIWYDIEGIESADAFRRKIIKAIDESNTVVFACSDNSLESEFCEKEIMYAKNVDKKVIPYLLPGMKLKGWLLFEYGNVNCIHASKEDEVLRMINDLSRWPQSDEDLQESQTPEDNCEKNFEKETEENITSTKDDFESQNPSGYSEEEDSVPQDTCFINGHEYVDLGLPSGLKWATCNIGAKRPEDYSDYFAWGEINTKSKYRSVTSETYRRGYTWLRNKGYIREYETNLSLSHDVARKKWRGTWRMPTEEEIAELIKHTYRKWVKDYNGVAGRLITSKINGNSIFLPAAGRIEGDYLWEEGRKGYYWSSIPFDEDTAYQLYIDSGSYEVYHHNRSYGFPVRPVSD